jgi:trk system potassium uptake protein TrkA
MAKRTFAVIGLGRFGSAVAATLAELGQEVIGIDSAEERVQEMADLIPQALVTDATDLKALRQAGVQDVDIAIISIGENIEASLLVVMQVKELGVKEIIAKAVTPLHGKILQKLGVTRIVFPEREMAMRIAHGLVVPNVLDYIELSRDFSIVEVPAPKDWIDKTLRELAVRQRYGLTLIAIKRRSGTSDGVITSIGPSADDRILAGDVLSLLGDTDRLGQLDRLLNRP